MKRAILLYNIQAGKGRAEKKLDKIVSIFREHDYEIQPLQIDFSVNPFDNISDVDLVVVAGGDGTLNYVVNRMKERGLDHTLGVLPAGTANDFAGALGMSRNVYKAARQIATGEVENIDCGVVEPMNGKGEKLYFVNIFSFGIFTTTSQHTSDEMKHKFGRLAYGIAGMHDLKNMHGIPLTITTDTESFYYPTLMALVFNGETAGRVRLARKSSLRDGVFDCLFLRKRNAFLSAMNMLLYLIGIKPRAVKFLRTKSLTLVTPTDEDTDVDGQNGGHFPLRVTCLAGELKIVCPKHPKQR